MKTAVLAAALLGFVLPMMAEDPPKVDVWSAAQLQSLVREAKPNERGISLARLGNWGNHGVQHELSTHGGGAEMHSVLSDVIVVTSGEMMLVYGGTMDDPKPSSPTETRGTRISGGTSRKIQTGDVVHVPAGIVHSLTIEPGKQATFLVVKIEKAK